MIHFQGTKFDPGLKVNVPFSFFPSNMLQLYWLFQWLKFLLMNEQRIYNLNIEKFL